MEIIGRSDNKVFGNCSKLKSIYIPSSVTHITPWAFYGCDENLEIICDEGSYAEECAKKWELKIGRRNGQTITAVDVTKILGDEPFSINAVTNGGGTLTYESDNTSVATVDENGKVVLTGVGTAHIKITASATKEYGSAEKTITITVKDNKPEKNTMLKSGKVTYQVTKKGEEVAYVKTTEKSSTVTIPATVKVNGISYKVTSVASKAFKNNKNLKKVTIGKNVSAIGDQAFSGCKKLTTVTLGENVTKIGKEAWKGCSKLGTITVRSAKLKSIGKNAFRGIKDTAKVKVPAKQLKAYKKLLKAAGLSSKAKITK